MCKVILLLLAAGAVWGAELLPEDRGSLGFFQTVKKLQTGVRIVYVTAHPDDEDPALLTYLSRGLGAEVTMLVLNRGEGGANVVSGDFFEALGALRTLEMVKAAQQYGVELRFTRAVDYGFSKNMGEALRQWGEEALERDVVRLVRQLRPHVLISRFNESERDGHGHHQTAGRMARLAYRDAGDADKFAELAAEGIDAWKPLKLYTTNWREGEPVTLRINTGAYSSVLGRSFAQIGREGYRWHRSQGMAGRIQGPGEVFAYLKLEASSIGVGHSEFSVLDGLPKTGDFFPGFTANGDGSVGPILAGLKGFVGERRGLYEKALAQGLALQLEALVEPENAPSGPMAMFRPVETLSVAQPGQSFRVRLKLHQGIAAELSDIQYSLSGPIGVSPTGVEGLFRVQVNADAAATVVPWHRTNVRDSVYTLSDSKWIGQAVPDSGIRARVSYSYRGVRAHIETEIESSLVDARQGAIRRPIVIGPALSVQFESSYGMAALGKRSYEVGVVLRNVSQSQQAGELRLRLPAGFSAVPASQAFVLSKEKDELRLRFTVSLPEAMESREYAIEAIASVGQKEYSLGFQPITQPGLGVLYLQEPAVHRLRAVDAKLKSGLRVGYIMGSGDEMPEGLRQLGVNAELLDTNELAAGDLSRFSTILVGIRAYAAREDVKRHNARLLDYVKQGGVLVVQYQTPEYDNNFGPYPYAQTRATEETSEEDAAVTILEPGAEVFRSPNRITAADFEGWVEQRGSKFFARWDAGWKPLIETHDQGQAPQKGVWLEARHGKGLYVYCAMAWYRQLPFAVPGAARLVANLVSLGAADAAWRGR